MSKKQINEIYGEEKEKENINNKESIEKLSQILKKNRRKLSEILGYRYTQRFNFSKFVTSFKQKQKQKQKQITKFEELKNYLLTQNINKFTMQQWNVFIEQNEFDTESIEYSLDWEEDETHINNEIIKMFFIKEKQKQKEKENEIDQKEEKKTTKTDEAVINQYSFGYPFRYWKYYKNNKWYIPQKYNDIKQEIMEQKDQIIDIQCFQNNIQKSNNYLQSDTVKTITAKYTHASVSGIYPREETEIHRNWLPLASLQSHQLRSRANQATPELKFHYNRYNYRRCRQLQYQ